MSVPVLLPRFNMEMEEGTVLRWLVAEGQEVSEGDPLCEVETDKVDMEVEAPATGRLTGIRVPEGTTVPVSSVLAYIAGADEVESNAEASPFELSEAAGEAPGGGTVPPDRSGADQGAGESRAPRRRPSEGLHRVRATPAARRLARERGLDLAALADDTGRVTMAAVRGAQEEQASRPAPTAAPASGKPLDPTRRAIAVRMVRAHEAPHITLDVEVRMRSLLELRTSWRAQVPSLTAMLAAAICQALARHPLLNSTFEAGSVTTHAEVNLGIAVARPEGLIVPVLPGADRLSLDSLSQRVRECVRKAREGSLTLDEISGGTFTITSLGEVGVDRFAPLVNPPQVAILAVGHISERVLPVPGGIGVEPSAWLSLTCDHRVVDGYPGAEFLASLKGLVESPSWMAP